MFHIRTTVLSQLIGMVRNKTITQTLQTRRDKAPCSLCRNWNKYLLYLKYLSEETLLGKQNDRFYVSGLRMLAMITECWT